MERIQAQANKLWQVISSPSTVKAYQQTLAVTWSILKETGQLLWLVLCLSLVAGDWFWKKSYKVGQDARVWIDTLQTKAETPEAGAEAPSPANFLSETGKSLLSAAQTVVTMALNTAKEQLGLEVQSKPPTKPVSVSTPPEPPKVATVPEPVVTSSATISPAEATSISPTQAVEDE